VWSSFIEEGHVFRDGRPRLAKVVVGVQIDLFVLERTPQPLDEDVVNAAAFPVHADLDASVEQGPREVVSSELGALVRVEDIGLAKPLQGFLKGVDAESGIEAV